METQDPGARRLYVANDLTPGSVFDASEAAAHYLRVVLRMPEGASLPVFNGRDGEWMARLAAKGKRGATLTILAQTRPQPPRGDLVYLFAPLKSARLDYLAQKAVEMGATRLAPTITRRSQAPRLNLDRLRANLVEAAEQCGILTLPDVSEPSPLTLAIAALEADRVLVFCDEEAPVSDPVATLSSAPEGRLALLIGPEGGFDEVERRLLLARPKVVRLSLGPRILRADTAAVAALALIQAVRGDWRDRI